MTKHSNPNGLSATVWPLLYKTLIEGGDGPHRHSCLDFLCTAAHADYLKLLFFSSDKTGMVISASLSSPQKDVQFSLASKVDLSLLPKDCILRHGKPGMGIGGTGARVPQSTIVLRLGTKHHILGLLEWGYLDKTVLPTDIEELVPILGAVQETFASLHRNLELRREKEALRRDVGYEHEILDLLFAYSHDLITTITLGGRIIRINDGGRSLLGFDKGQETDTLVLESPSMEHILGQFQVLHCINDIELILLNNLGQPVFFIGSIIAIRDSRHEVTGLHLVCKSINEHIAAQRELWLNNIKLNELNRQLVETQSQVFQSEKLASIGQLAAGIAHEINNPLGFIKSNHETLISFMERLYDYVTWLETQIPDVKAARIANRVQKTIFEIPQILQESTQGFKRIIEIVQSLKNFSRMEDGQTLAQVDVNKLINDTITVTRNTWKYVAEIRTSLDLMETVEGFGGLLNQVFLNCIVNAAQAIASLPNKESPGLIAVKTSRLGDMAVITFEDSGPGVPDEVRDRVFDPFFTTKPVGEGTGLGLSVSQDIIVNKHKGSIDLGKSTLGGAVFTIRLPLLQSSGLQEVQNI